MPTLILLDTSLSMGRALGSETARSLAALGLGHLAALLKDRRLEMGAVGRLSHCGDLVEPWGRDWDLLGAAAEKLEPGTKRRLPEGLSWARQECSRVWAADSLIHLFLFTDGKGLSGPKDKDELAALFPFPLPLRFHLIALAQKSSVQPKVLSDLQWVVNLANADTAEALALPSSSGLHFLEQGSPEELYNLIKGIVDSDYESHQAELRCGSLSAQCHIYPAPLRAPQESDFTTTCPPFSPVLKMGLRTRKVSEKVEVIGFLKPTEWGSPGIFSRHLLLPLDGISPDQSQSSPIAGSKEDKDPNFCVLLHGGLKTELAVAVVRVA